MKRVRKIRHKTPKFFGFPNEKWARGGGRYGYGRCYGKNKHGDNVDYRTRAEKLNKIQRSEENGDE